MESASTYTFLGRPEQPTHLYGMPGMGGRDLNIFIVKFDGTKQAEKNIGAGDPFYCEKCRVCFNKLSTLLGPEQYKKRVDEAPLHKIEEEPEQMMKSMSSVSSMMKEVPIPPKLIELGPKDMAWICEFCSHHNRLRIEKEEIPSEADMVYIIESASQKLGGESPNDSTIVFCIDNSGSMNTTQQIKGKVSLKHGISAHELEMLRQFMEPGDEAQLNYFPGQNSANTFVSRKQCVMAAIESQLAEVKKSDPNKRVGLVTFNNEVVVYGDCTEDAKHIVGDKLYKLPEILTDLSTLRVKEPIRDASERLQFQLNKIEASGATALGPAILSAIELAGKGSPGSAVVVCTDGLANIGLGSLDPLTEEANQFYADLAIKAKEKNIIVNIVTIKGEGCKLEALSALSKQTNGNVSIVNPENIGDDFSNILKDEVVGLNVNVRIRLPESLRFRNELKENLKENESVLEKHFANATVDTKVSFEYELKSEPELRALGIDPKKISKLFFQAQVIYTSLQGHRFMRVITKETDVTTDRKVLEKAANLPVVHTRIAQQSTAFMGSGMEREAQAYNAGWVSYIGHSLNSEPAQMVSNNAFLGDNERMNKAYKHKKMKADLKQKKQLRKKVEEEGVAKPANLSDDEQELEKELNRSLVDSDEDERMVHDFGHGKKFK